MQIPMRLLTWTCLLFVLLPVCAAAQSEASEAAGAKGPGNTIIKNVNEVSFDLSVHKGRRGLVLDLKPADLEVTDDSSPVTLTDLHLVNWPSDRNHLITFVFDRLAPSGATNAQEVAKKIEKMLPQQGFAFSVFSCNAQLQLLQGFTSDREAIQKAVTLAVGDNSSGRAQAAALSEKMLLAFLQSAPAGQQSSEYRRTATQAELASLAESQRIEENENTTPVLAGLLALAQTQAQIPGRKLLVYFTSGLRSDADTADMLRSVTGAALRANVSIYVINNAPLDSKVEEGLMQAQAMGALAAYNRANPAPTGPAAQIPGVFSGGMVSEVGEQVTRGEGEGLAGSKDPLAIMAKTTGGAYLFSEDNLKKPFRQAVADLDTYYEASYVPPPHEFDGRFHKIVIKPLRHGLKIQAEAGYFAIPKIAGMRPYEMALMKMFSTVNVPHDVPFRASVLRLGRLTFQNENSLVVEVPVAGLQLQSDPNANLLSWDVLIISEIKNTSGNVMANFSEDIPGHGALTLKPEVEAGWVTMQRHFALPAGKYILETAVVDRNGGKIGGQSTNFEIADQNIGPSLSDLILVRRIDSYPYELDPLEPLRYRKGRVVPTLARSVPQGTKDVSLFFLVHPESGVSDSAILQMEVLRDDELLGQMPLQLPKNLGEAFPYVASLKAASLPAGDYEVRLSLSQNGKVFEREASFTIPGAELADATGGKMGSDVKNQESTGLDPSNPKEEMPWPRKQPLSITALPTDSTASPSWDEVNKLIAGARKYATSYAAKLPNFLCIEITDRAVDSSGKGIWRRRDSFAESLRFVNKQEIRNTLEFNGHPSTRKRADMSGPISLGEFGELLSGVFLPGAKAEFHWKETDALAHDRVQLLEYRVRRKNNSMLLSDGGARVYVGFHGLVYIDAATMGVRRITMQADDLPPKFSIHAASISVDYDYVTVGRYQYLMPVRGTIRVQRGRHEVDLNQVVFQEYRRYASEVKISTAP